MKKIGILIGSLRKKSYSRIIAKNMALMLPIDIIPSFIDVSELPLFNEDIEHQNIASWESFRTQISEMDGLIFVTPEYNRSVPGCLKNALDIGSRSEKHIFAGVPTVVVSCSTGKMGGYGASQHLKEILLSLGIKLIQPAELYLGNIQSLLDNDRFINNNFIDGILNKAVNSLIRSLELENDSQTINQVAAGKIQSGISRYQLKRTSMNVFDENGTLNCKAEFTVDDSYLSINHITICQDRAGNDFVTIIMLKLLIFASLFELKVIPSCSYAVNFLEEYLIKK